MWRSSSEWKFTVTPRSCSHKKKPRRSAPRSPKVRRRRYAVPAALGILLGARLGPLLAMRLRSRTLGVILQVLLVVFAVLMAVRTVQG